jgi:hypothetical protein
MGFRSGKLAAEVEKRLSASSFQDDDRGAEVRFAGEAATR